MLADSIWATLAFVYFMAAEENVTKLLLQCSRENSNSCLALQKMCCCYVFQYNFYSIGLFTSIYDTIY